MFKLVKILNSGVNVAEGMYLKAGASMSYKIGTAAKIANGTAVSCAATDMPTHIVGESATAGEKAKIFCYPVMPSMVFETLVSASPSQLKVGDKVTLSVSDGIAEGVSATTASGVATIYDLADAKAAGDTVYVIFK